MVSSITVFGNFQLYFRYRNILKAFFVGYSMKSGSWLTFSRIKSGFSFSNSFREKIPVKTATVLVPAAFPAFMSAIESPTTTQSYAFALNCLAHFFSASGEGFGWCVSKAVITYLKYFAKPKLSSSLMISLLGT